MKSVLRNTSLVFLYIILGMVSYVLLTQAHVIGEFILGSAFYSWQHSELLYAAHASVFFSSWPAS